MTYTRAVAYPSIDSARAVAALRDDLRVAAQRDGAVPDWSTLRITGPTDVVGAHGRLYYEWVATVEVRYEPARYL